MARKKFVFVGILAIALGAVLAQKQDQQPTHQYHSGEISIPPASLAHIQSEWRSDFSSRS